VHKLKKSLYVWLSILLVSQSLFFYSSASAADVPSSSLGSVIDHWTRTVASGVEESFMMIDSSAGKQEAFVMNVDTQNEYIHIEAGIPNGNEFGMQTVRDQASFISEPGHVVVGGVNGDFYNLANGIPTGSVIRNGHILKTSTTETFGVKENGTAIIGNPSPTFHVSLSGKKVTLDNVNGTRSVNQLVAYTSDKQQTNTASDGTEVVLTKLSGDIRKAGEMTATVESVHPNSGNTTIPEGKLVLSASGTNALLLNELKTGQAVTFTTSVSSGWENVTQALGGRITLVKNGQKSFITETAFTTTRAPRTAVGIKADGSIFFTVIDGRQPGYSEGITIYELQDLMMDLGAVDALNLDGGGSSTFVTRTNGRSGLDLVNQPSDGYERSVANSFFIVSTAPQSSLQQLAIQPEHLLMLAGSSYDFNAAGMDAAHHPITLDTEPSWSVSDLSLGSISETGLFQSGEADVTGQINSDVNGAAGSSSVTVTSKLTEVQLPQETITMQRGETMELNVKALLNGKHVYANHDNFQWKVTGNIGSVDEKGVFHAANQSGSGTLTVSYGDVVDTMNVQIGKMPVVIETFENGLDDWQATGARYQSLSIRQTTYPEPARFGNHALELNYDFTGTIGTSGAYASTKQPIVIDDYPEKIGMWVYGDGNNHWLRSQLRDGNNNAFPIDFAAKMDWTGWKYVEAAVPAGKATPLKLDLAVRLMETNNANKNTGTIYVDNIRAVYGETNDDLINPEITNESPADQEVLAVNGVRISVVAKDNEDGTGINPARTRMFLDGEEVTAATNETTGEISYIPSSPLLDGYHQAKVMVQDHFGNEAERTWQFEVDSDGTGLKPAADLSAHVGNDYTVSLETNQLQHADTISLHFTYDPAKLTAAGPSLLLDETITEKHVQRNEITADGHIYLELKNLNELESAKMITELASIPFSIPIHAAEPISIKFADGIMTLANTEKAIPLYMPDIHTEINAHHAIDIDRTSVSFPTKITIRDEEGNPVSDAVIRILSPDARTLGTTDKKGTLKTDKFSLAPGKLVIQSQKKNQYSFQKTVTVLDHLGSSQPERTNVTFSEKPKMMNVSWTTSPLITSSIVELVETSTFKKTGFDGKSVKKIKGENKEFAFDAGEVQVHSASLNGLKPNTAYTYRVGDGTKDHWSEAAVFTTAPKANEPFNFIVMGDTQAPPNQSIDGFGIFTELFTIAKEEYTDASFMMHVGDMVDDGNLYSHWNAFFESMKATELAPSTPIVPTVGNHENIGTGVNTFTSLFNTPQNGAENFKGTNYSFDYGSAHFAVLNTETTKEGLLEQAEWLKKDMKKTKKKWKIVVYHRSPYYSNPAGGSEMVKSVFPAVFDELNIDLAISGHDHSYVRTFPLENGEKSDSGTTYVIAGSTGKKFYTTTPQPFMDVYYDEDLQVYTNVSVDENGITIFAKNINGQIVDEHTITK
jgi:hypothetical protein